MEEDSNAPKVCLCLDSIAKSSKNFEGFNSGLFKIIGDCDVKVVGILKIHVYLLCKSYGVGFVWGVDFTLIYIDVKL